MTGMAAAQMGDINNLLELIRNYVTEYCENRKYPLYTGEAGWICMECEKLYSLYEKNKNRIFGLTGLPAFCKLLQNIKYVLFRQ